MGKDSPTFVFNMRPPNLPEALLVAAILLVPVVSQACSTTSAQGPIPTGDINVALHTYSYCGGNLQVQAYIANVNYNKVVRLNYADASGYSNPRTYLSLGYEKSVDDTDGFWEFWGVSGPVSLGGVSRLLNLTYQAVDIERFYSQTLNLPVERSGKPPPSRDDGLPDPYATPSGYSADITTWMSTKGAGSEIPIAFAKMFSNIKPLEIPSSADSSVVAARSGPAYPQKVRQVFF